MRGEISARYVFTGKPVKPPPSRGCIVRPGQNKAPQNPDQIPRRLSLEPLPVSPSYEKARMLHCTRKQPIRIGRAKRMVRASGGREEGGRVQKGAGKENSHGNRDSVSRTQEKKGNAPRTCAPLAEGFRARMTRPLDLRSGRGLARRERKVAEAQVALREMQPLRQRRTLPLKRVDVGFHSGAVT